MTPPARGARSSTTNDTPSPRELVRGRKAGDAAADDRDVNRQGARGWGWG